MSESAKRIDAETGQKVWREHLAKRYTLEAHQSRRSMWLAVGICFAFVVAGNILIWTQTISPRKFVNGIKDMGQTFAQKINTDVDKKVGPNPVKLDELMNLVKGKK